jgi:hypothetical protein
MRSSKNRWRRRSSAWGSEKEEDEDTGAKRIKVENMERCGAVCETESAYESGDGGKGSSGESAVTS